MPAGVGAGPSSVAGPDPSTGRSPERTRYMVSNRRDFAREPISLRDAVDRLVRDNIVRPAADLVTQMSRSLPVDVADTEQSFIVEASLPGLTADDVTITLQ